MNMWQEWRGPRKDWSLRLKVTVWTLVVALGVAWASLVDRYL